MRQFTILLFSIISLCHLTDTAYCQLKYGVKGGLGVTKGKFQMEETDYAIRFHGGFLTEISLTEKIYVRPELLFSQKGWKVPDDNLNSDVSVTINYLNLPIVAGYKLFKSLSVSTGPELGLKLSSKRNPSGSWIDPYEKFDMGWAIGCNYLLNEKIGLDLRYVYGFKGLIKGEMRDMNNNKTGTFREGSNRAIQISAFYLIHKPSN